jgi:hypothetical protein
VVTIKTKANVQFATMTSIVCHPFMCAGIATLCLCRSRLICVHDMLGIEFLSNDFFWLRSANEMKRDQAKPRVVQRFRAIAPIVSVATMKRGDMARIKE